MAAQQRSLLFITTAAHQSHSQSHNIKQCVYTMSATNQDGHKP